MLGVSAGRRKEKVCYHGRRLNLDVCASCGFFGKHQQGLVIVTPAESHSGGGSAYFVYFICFFQGTLQM